jgi:hypothetical protein
MRYRIHRGYCVPIVARSDTTNPAPHKRGHPLETAFLANAKSSLRAHADASKLRRAAAESISLFSSSVQRKRKYVDLACPGFFFGLAIRSV